MRRSGITDTVSFGSPPLRGRYDEGGCDDTVGGSMTKPPRFDHSGTARFVTIVCHKRYPVFVHESHCSIFLNWLADLRNRSGIRVLGYVIMPDHIHLVLWPPADAPLGFLIGQCKGRAAREILSNWTGRIPKELGVQGPRNRQHRIFQPKCYDHSCRTVEDVRQKIEYCHANPQKSGLLNSPEEWVFSSCR
jgi:putative transposase